MSDAGFDVFDSLKYVSRGGQKLAKALDYFDVSPQDKVCIDCGASTGGFTDCLLQRGARLVYAIDVGYGQLAWTLRNDPRVKVMERTNIRYVTQEQLSEKPELSVIDVSFISLSLVLPVIGKLMSPDLHHCGLDPQSPEVIALIKPQFEAGKGKVGKKGVVRDPGTHEEVLYAFMEHAVGSGFTVKGLVHSPVKGPKGNIEYLGYLSLNNEEAVTENDGHGNNKFDIKAIVAESHKELDV